MVTALIIIVCILREDSDKMHIMVQLLQRHLFIPLTIIKMNDQNCCF